MKASFERVAHPIATGLAAIHLAEAHGVPLYVGSFAQGWVPAPFGLARACRKAAGRSPWAARMLDQYGVLDPTGERCADCAPDT